MLHGHGNDTLLLKHKVKVDFSSNIWYENVNKGLLHHLQQKLSNICNYPPVDASNLQRKVADFYCLKSDRVCISSGATEAFYLLAHLYKQKTATVIGPAFSEYEDACRMYNLDIQFISNAQLHEDSQFKTDLVWLGNPNNPDGKVQSLEFIKTLLQNNTNALFVIDEAYGDLCAGFNSAISLLKEYENLVIVKSVTKLCSIPGLRLGYLIGNESLIHKIGSLRMPWSVATLAIEAGLYIYDHFNDFKLNVDQIYQECSSFQHLLKENTNVKVFPSCTNYFLSELTSGTAAELKSYLLEKHGFLIRDCSNFRGLTERHFRMAVQGQENNKQCVNAIQTYLEHAH